MNGKSQCCNAPVLRDSTGDVICTGCGLITDNTKKEDATDGRKGEAHEGTQGD